MASSGVDTHQHVNHGHLAESIKAEIILTTTDKDKVLLWKSDGRDQWKLPWFVLKENESFRQGIDRWCLDQLVYILSPFEHVKCLYKAEV